MINFCKLCLNPSTRPNTYFDKNGICPVCIYEKNKSKSDENWIENFVKSQTSKNIIPKNISDLSNKNLLNLLKKLVASEDYEGAVKIRDEISKRKNK